MGLSNDFLLLASTTVQVAPLSTTVNDYGTPSYSAASTFDAVVEDVVRLVTAPDGREEVSRTTVYVLSSSAAVGVQDRITLPNGATPRILNVATLDDDEGQHHVEVMLA